MPPKRAAAGKPSEEPPAKRRTRSHAVSPEPAPPSDTPEPSEQTKPKEQPVKKPVGKPKANSSKKVGKTGKASKQASRKELSPSTEQKYGNLDLAALAKECEARSILPKRKPRNAEGFINLLVSDDRKVSNNDYDSLTVPRLRRLLEERGVEASGLKADLIRALRRHDLQQEQPSASQGRGSGSEGTPPRPRQPRLSTSRGRASGSEGISPSIRQPQPSVPRGRASGSEEFSPIARKPQPSASRSRVLENEGLSPSTRHPQPSVPRGRASGSEEFSPRARQVQSSASRGRVTGSAGSSPRTARPLPKAVSPSRSVLTEADKDPSSQFPKAWTEVELLAYDVESFRVLNQPGQPDSAIRLRQHNVAGDGSCFWHAFAHGYERLLQRPPPNFRDNRPPGTDNDWHFDHGQARRAAQDIVDLAEVEGTPLWSARQEFYDAIRVLQFVIQGDNLDAQLYEEGVFATDAMAYLLADYYDVEIVIWTLRWDTATSYWHPVFYGEAGRPQVMLAHYEMAQHFTSVWRERDPDDYGNLPDRPFRVRPEDRETHNIFNPRTGEVIEWHPLRRSDRHPRGSAPFENDEEVRGGPPLTPRRAAVLAGTAVPSIESDPPRVGGNTIRLIGREASDSPVQGNTIRVIGRQASHSPAESVASSSGKSSSSKSSSKSIVSISSGKSKSKSKSKSIISISSSSPP